MSEESARTWARAQYELRLTGDYGVLDRVYDTVEMCGFTVDHVEVLRAAEGRACHIVMEGWASGLQWLDESILAEPDVELVEGVRVCSICRSQGVKPLRVVATGP